MYDSTHSSWFIHETKIGRFGRIKEKQIRGFDCRIDAVKYAEYLISIKPKSNFYIHEHFDPGI